MATSRHFFLNLRRDVTDAFTRDALAPHGYLVPPQRVGPTLRSLAGDVSQRGYETLVDNGNFAVLGRVRKRHAIAAGEISNAVRALEERLGRSARRRDIPTGLRAQLKALVSEATASVAELVPTAGDQLARQLTLTPSRLIGVEDIVPACLLALDIEPRLGGSDRSSLRRRNTAVARGASAACSTLPRELRRQYFPVASANSFNTAHDAGRIFASHGHRRIAMGFGAYMADSNYVDHFRVGRSTTTLKRRIPNRYLRTVLVARGFWEGYVSELGKPPLAFHFLGLGAPIMLPLVSLVAWGTPELTFDATSPVKDATRGGTLYVSKPAYLKVRTRKVALKLVTTDREWDCPCPYCQDFIRRHPFQYREARRVWQTIGREAVVAADLTEGGPLFGLMPLLSEPRGGYLRKAVNFTRTGHNHWAMFEVLRELDGAGARKTQARRHVAEVVESYRRVTSPVFSFALDVAFSVATGAL